MKAFLKVNLLSLMAESRIIKQQERKHKDGSAVRTGLKLHRIRDVRSETRSAFIAYGYLRGRTYAQVEPNPKTEPNWARVGDKVAKFGTPQDVHHFKKWKPSVSLLKRIVQAVQSAVA